MRAWISIQPIFRPKTSDPSGRSVLNWVAAVSFFRRLFYGGSSVFHRGRGAVVGVSIQAVVRFLAALRSQLRPERAYELVRRLFYDSMISVMAQWKDRPRIWQKKSIVLPLKLRSGQRQYDSFTMSPGRRLHQSTPRSPFPLPSGLTIRNVRLARANAFVSFTPCPP